jgi:hypothetical protein
MHRTNPHGAGYAWVQGGVVHWEKGINNMVYLHKRMTDLDSGPRLLHFRLSSIGGIHRSLCHPFPVERNPSVKLRGTASSVLIHNGHWSGHSIAQFFLKYTPGKLHSDTRVMAHIAAINRPDILKYIASQGQKFATLSHKGIVTQWGKWVEMPDGTRYSNTLWQIAPKVAETAIDPEAWRTFDADAYLADYRAREAKRATQYAPSYQRMSEAEYDALMRDADNA